MKIALIYPRWTSEYGNIAWFAKKSGRWPPLNLAYLAAYSEAQGHETIIIDAEAEGLSARELINRTKQFCPELIGITATTPFYHIAVSIAEQFKLSLPKAAIAIGGPHITVLKEQVFNQCFDYAFLQEADHSWQEFLDRVANGKPARDIPGMLYRLRGRVIWSGSAIPCREINQVPIPSRHLLKPECYRLGTINGLKRFTTIMTVRGCPYRCIFCSTNVFGKNLRMRSPALVVSEMEQCISRFGVTHFMFLDDTLTMNRNHILAICDGMIKAGLRVTFEGSTRANMVDEQLIARMVGAGLVRISFGLESVDEEIRSTMKKQVPLDSYIRANEITNRFGVETLNSCMIGLPGETRLTVKKTLAFLRRSKEIKQANISIAVPYPGTELFDMAKRGEHGLQLMTEDFSQYRRYNAAVMTVGELSPKELIQIQNEGFASIYLAPWRWGSMVRKYGFIGAIMTFMRLARCLLSGKTNYLTNRQLKIT